MKPYYSHAGITIFHGDCREVLESLGRHDLLCTDPPYGLGAARKNFGGKGVKRHMTGLCSGKAIPKRDYGDAAWDDVVVSSDLLDAARALCEHHIIFGGNYFNLGPARCYLVWDKLRGETDYADAELAWTNLNRSVRVIRWRWNGFLQQNHGNAKENRFHPTQKPFSVMTWAINQAPPGCSSILDPFMGSGTTLLAAKSLRKQATGIEIEERYCDLAAKRLSQEVIDFSEVSA